MRHGRLKPTYGAVSRYGLIAYASSFDQIGPITETVEDAALVYDAIAQYDDRRFHFPRRRRRDGRRSSTGPLAGMKIGIAEGIF